MKKTKKMNKKVMKMIKTRMILNRSNLKAIKTRNQQLNKIMMREILNNKKLKIKMYNKQRQIDFKFKMLTLNFIFICLKCNM